MRSKSQVSPALRWRVSYKDVDTWGQEPWRPLYALSTQPIVLMADMGFCAVSTWLSCMVLGGRGMEWPLLSAGCHCQVGDEQMQRGLASPSWFVPGSSSQLLTNSCPGHHQRLTETYGGHSCTEATAPCQPPLSSLSRLDFWDWPVNYSTSALGPSFSCSSQLCEVSSRSLFVHNTQGTGPHSPNPDPCRECSALQSEAVSVPCCFSLCSVLWSVSLNIT